MDWTNLAALAATAVLFAGVYALNQRKVNFSLLTIGALLAGIPLGVVFQGHVDWIKPVGTIYLHVLLAIVAPLIIISILSSVVQLGSHAKLRSIGIRSVVWLLAINAIAVVLTLGLALATRTGSDASVVVEGINVSALENLVQPFTDVVVDFFPTNIVSDIADNKIIPIIIFTLMVAVAYTMVAERSPEKVRVVAPLIEALREIIYRAVGFVIVLTPYAVLTLTAVAAANATEGGDRVTPLLSLLVLAFVACLLDTFVVNSVLLRVWADVSPLQFFRKLVPAQMTAFTTQSSVATLPVTTDVLTRRVGVPTDVANFTAPLGTTIGMPGCSGIWPILVAVFGVHALGIDYTLQDYVVLAVLGIVVSVGTAGVPGTATITTTTVLTAAGLPLELVAVTLPISTIADMARTMTNVTSAAVAATIVARQVGRLDDAIFEGTKDYVPDPEPVLVSPGGPGTDDDLLGWDGPGRDSVPVGQCSLPAR